ncbi:MAG TPA: SpoIIE family protein phosphatase [Candidatus Gallacutalibacter pullicola]|uniref:SpoIIE family protein phosphatase n=1 Tax=Candidatus Gallacutalibacter pullicola TaxID=2840830 RepID=A0A9D1DNM9_9FIRM|nr:SpoIIE family protein phosphatase [Candidatus Gallacutalibacter pullicola]
MHNSLRAKLLLGIIVFSALLGASISFLGYQEFTSVLEQQYNAEAYHVAEMARSCLNPDKFDEYLSTGQTDEEYEEIQALLDDLTEAMEATFIYVARVDKSDYRTLTYIYDSVNSQSGFSRYELGYTHIGVNEAYVEDVKNIVDHGGSAMGYMYTYVSESGAHATAGLPVSDSSGEVVAILGVEVPMTILDEARMAYVYHVMIVTVVVLVLFLAVYLLFLNRSLIRPVEKITSEAKRFADTNVKSTDALAEIHQRDEIGILASSITKMEADVENYIQNLTAVTAEKERISTELSVATQIQADMLPSIFPPFPNRTEFEIYASMRPAKEVGGDFYDFFLTDEDHLGIVIADVSGKGVPAALFMVIAKTLIKNHAQNGETPAEIFTSVNDQLCENNKEGMFVTAWMGILELSSGKLTYVNAGHNPPLRKTEDGRFEYFKSPAGFVLAGLEGIPYKQHEEHLNQGDMLYLYTDGVTEAADVSERLYGEDRLQNTLNANVGLAPEELILEVQKDISVFVGEADQSDDITMLCLEFHGPNAPKVSKG